MKNDRQITISIGSSRKSTNWQKQRLTLSELYQRISLPVRSTKTLAEYLQLPKSKQDDLKDVGGFVAGALNGPRRKADAVVGRDVITLDMDNIPPYQAEDIIQKVDLLCIGYCIYSTRKHRPEAPRLRVLIPLDRTATADEYEACARKIAQWIQIEAVDPTTFEPSRLMYWGSVCSDGEWIYRTGDKQLLSVDSVLSLYIDWRDVNSWPRVPGEATPTSLARRQTDPETKQGLVGAFCRAYSVVTAMEVFIPGAYEPAGEGRYTFTGGSTTGGAVVYDNDKFLYSHHATDPCSGQLVNAWDMVRLHKFGHLDDEAPAGTRGGSLPSYRAMAELAGNDNTVGVLMAREQWQEAQRVFNTAVSQEPAEGSQNGVATEDEDRWEQTQTQKLKKNGKNGYEKVIGNYFLTLTNEPHLKGRLRLNVFSGRIDVVGALPWPRPRDAGSWNDDDTAMLRIYLEKLFPKAAKADLQDAVAAAASEQAYHPVREYLTTLEWDGVDRLDKLFIDYLGSEDTPYTRAVTRKSFVAAAARILDPGCKYDTMVVLVGKQGRHKSTILAKMGGTWFSDSLRTFGDKDAMETIQGTWINEVAEMQAMSRSDVDAVKMFLTKRSDYYRAAYGHYTMDRPRQCVFFGTTNSTECLTDITGGRRFWIVDIDKQTRKKNVFEDLDGERDQLWAEAVARWNAGEPLHLPPELEATARILQESHRTQHPWEAIIRDFLDKEVPVGWDSWDEGSRTSYYNKTAVYDGENQPRDRVCALEIWAEALKNKPGNMKRNDAKEINSILESISGWVRIGTVRAGKPYGVQRCFGRV